MKQLKHFSIAEVLNGFEDTVASDMQSIGSYSLLSSIFS